MPQPSLTVLLTTPSLPGVILYRKNRQLGEVRFSKVPPSLTRDVSGPASHVLRFDSIQVVATAMKRGKQAGEIDGYQWKVIEP